MYADADSLQAKSTKNNTNKPKMIDIDLNRYLESKLTFSEYSRPESEMPTSSLDAIGIHLKQTVHSLVQNKGIAEHFVFGEELSRFKDLFRSLKRKTNSKKNHGTPGFKIMSTLAEVMLVSIL